MGTPVGYDLALTIPRVNAAIVIMSAGGNDGGTAITSYAEGALRATEQSGQPNTLARAGQLALTGALDFAISDRLIGPADAEPPQRFNAAEPVKLWVELADIRAVNAGPVVLVDGLPRFKLKLHDPALGMGTFVIVDLDEDPHGLIVGVTNTPLWYSFVNKRGGTVYAITLAAPD